MTAAYRSYLYAPGAAPEVMRKALAAGADAVVLDLEDAVAPAAKSTARAAVAELLAELAANPPVCAVHVRINRNATGYDRDDLDAVVGPALGGLRLPKADDPAELVALAALLDDLERQRGIAPGAVGLYPIVETARACTVLGELAAAPRVRQLAFGGADLAADLGVPADSALLAHVAAQLVVHSRAAGLPGPIDRVHTAVRDVDGLRVAAESAARLGFTAKSIIHPAQIEPVHAAFVATPEQLAWAEAVVAAAAAADQAGAGVAVVDGEFVDAAVVARARGLLSRRTPE